MDNAEHQLAVLDRQRYKLADNLRVPPWYLVLYGCGVASLLITFALNALGMGVLAWAVQFVIALPVIVSPGFVLPRITGLRLRDNPTKIYPSARRSLALLLGVLTLGGLASWLSSANGLVVASFLVPVLGGVSAALVLRHTYRGIRSDIKAGRVRA